MEKPMILLETTGNFMLVDEVTGAEIHSSRPTVAPYSPFIQERAAARQLKILQQDLPETAKDEEFATYWTEAKGDRDLAISSYLSQFTKEPAKPAGKK